MTTLKDEYSIENIAELGLGKPNRYEPHRDLRFYPGAQLSAERRVQLDADAVEPDELSTDDIVYLLSKMVTGTMYGLIEQIEERWGKEAARECVLEWGRRRGRENIRKWMAARGETRITPDLWVRFQDYRHLISGPTHAHSFMDYGDDQVHEGVATVVLNRTGCLFHTTRPAGMDSYSAQVAHGKFIGYAEEFPEITSEYGFCMAEGTSQTGCQVLFHIKVAGSSPEDDAPARSST